MQVVISVITNLIDKGKIAEELRPDCNNLQYMFNTLAKDYEAMRAKYEAALALARAIVQIEENESY